MSKINDTEKLDALLASVTDDMLGDDLPQYFNDNHIKVERILLEMVRPDPVQPRRVLSEQLHHKFHNNRLTPTQALRELVQVAQVSARQQGRPFANVLELLPNAESDQEITDKLSPEENILRDLVNLAITIRDDGQVNPLTVVDISQGVTRLYRIETGERRYWAAWLLRNFISGYESDGMIDCIVIPAERASAFRQAKENTARKGLNAIAMARQAALLLLTVHGCEIPNEAVTNDFYRQALELDLRGKREFTESILSAMGGVTKQRLNQYKKLLLLSDEAWELADRHGLDEGVLHYVVDLPTEVHIEMLQQIIQLGLSGRQVKAILHQTKIPNEEDTKLESPLAKFTRTAIKTIEKQNPVDFAHTIVKQQGDIHMALAYLNRFEDFIKKAREALTNIR
ncbi:MAG: ParB N-terminal domain-containing protein [Anaerolineae bacterium]|nr:ParB N-terminal domain-containing protein [Anaerolineae bacterium]